MKISKWGNSLALRIPAEVVQSLQLKEDDDIEIRVLGDREFGIRRDKRKEHAVESLRKLGWAFPEDFRFDRQQANER